jgi:xanthine dehydrogenase accessory factor
MTAELEWIERLSDLKSSATPCALVVVTGVKGSTPREVGARLLVADGKLVWGTIGGGRLEQLAIEHAASLLQTDARQTDTQVYPLSDRTGQCCGGEVTLFFESFAWSRPAIVVFGAGHVAQALGGLAGYLGASMRLIDGRHESEILPSLPPERPYELTCVDAPEGEIAALAPSSLVLVMTHSHALDLEIIRLLVERACFPYIGLIGSSRKWARFEQRLTARGLSEEQIASVTCPIGSARTSKEPTAIAISAAAELLQVMDRQAAR